MTVNEWNVTNHPIYTADSSHHHGMVPTMVWSPPWYGMAWYGPHHGMVPTIPNHVSNMVRDHTMVVTGVWCIDWVNE